MSILDTALAEVPGLAEVDAALDALKQRVADLNAELRTSDAGVADQVRAALLAGDPVPDDLGARLLAEEQTRRARTLELETLGRVLSRDSGSGLAHTLAVERREILRSGTDAALAVLRTELDRILAEAVEADTALAGAATAEQAIEADAADAWRTLSRLVGEYDEIRTAQARLVRDAADDRAAAQRWLTAAGWERGQDPGPHWPDADRHGHLRRLATAGTAWLPTLEELQAAADPTTPDEPPGPGSLTVGSTRARTVDRASRRLAARTATGQAEAEDRARRTVPVGGH